MEPCVRRPSGFLFESVVPSLATRRTPYRFICQIFLADRGFWGEVSVTFRNKAKLITTFESDHLISDADFCIFHLRLGRIQNTRCGRKSFFKENSGMSQEGLFIEIIP